MLQHRQLHKIFITILCTAIYLLHYAGPSMLLCVSLDCSADGVSPPSGAIRNRRSILWVAAALLYLLLFYFAFYATLGYTLLSASTSLLFD